MGRAGLRVLAATILCWAWPCLAAAAGDFLVEVKLSTADGEFANEVYFVDEMALELIDGTVDSVFDLSAMTWWHGEHGRIRLDQCREWGEATIVRTLASAVTVPDSPVKTLTLALMQPEFTVEERDGAVILRNAYLRYRIESSPGLSPAQTVRLHAYDRLNAYKKAMTGGELPPFSQLALTRELERRGIAPASIAIRMKTDAATLDATTTYRYLQLPAERSEEIRALLAGP